MEDNNNQTEAEVGFILTSHGWYTVASQAESVNPTVGLPVGQTTPLARLIPKKYRLARYLIHQNNFRF